MIRRILLGAIAAIFLLLMVLGLYIFFIIVERPNENYDVSSVVHNKEFMPLSKEAESWLQSVYRNNKIPSLSVAVGYNGELAWSGVIGYSDLAEKVVANQNTVYRIGSISKSITASGFVRMAEKGIISPNDFFNEYVSDYSSGRHNFTLEQLLAHQSGVRHYTSIVSENFSNKEYSTIREAASIVENDELLFSPGTGFNYSTYGYTLLSLAMESAYSLPFEEIMVKEVLSPIGMTSTYLDKENGPKGDGVATPYLLIENSIFKSPEVNLSYKYAGGGYLSTPSDIVKFGNALIGNSFLSYDSIEKLLTPVPLNNGETNPENYALGFRIGEDELGRFVHHGGMSVGGYSFFIVYPDVSLVIALATNITPMDEIFNRYDEAKKLANIFLL